MSVTKHSILQAADLVTAYLKELLPHNLTVVLEPYSHDSLPGILVSQYDPKRRGEAKVAFFATSGVSFSYVVYLGTRSVDYGATMRWSEIKQDLTSWEVVAEIIGGYLK